MRTVKLETEPFTCPSCIKKIESAVGKLPAVDSTHVMFNSNKVKVSHDDDLVNAKDIAKTISDLGYPVLSRKLF